MEIPKYINTYGLKDYSNNMRRYIKQVQNFVLWHYNCGSKYNTPFWDYAKSLRFIDPQFSSVLRRCKNITYDHIHRGLDENPYPTYGQWTDYSFKIWYEGMTKKEK